MDWYNTRCSIWKWTYTFSLPAKAGVVASFMIVCSCIYALPYPKTSMSVRTSLPRYIYEKYASSLPQTLVSWWSDLHQASAIVFTTPPLIHSCVSLGSSCHAGTGWLFWIAFLSLQRLMVLRLFSWSADFFLVCRLVSASTRWTLLCQMDLIRLWRWPNVGALCVSPKK